MKWIVVLVAVGALIAPVAAWPAASDLWWSTDHAEAVLLDSDWAFDHDVEDANCVGWGSYKLDADGGKSFRRFVCTAYAQVTTTWCLPGECATDSATETCSYRVKLRTTGLQRFLLSGVRSSC